MALNAGRDSPPPYATRSLDHSALPPPDQGMREHSARLCDCIRTDIRAQGGSISFHRYMELALYEPGLGYYSSGAAKFGKGGDFVTAPEISPLFARCLARQCRQTLAALSDPVIVEYGPGTGALACDLLLALEQEQCLPQRYCLLEVSADLKERQQQLLGKKIPHLLARVQWLDQLPARDFNGIVLANEVLDAMPVHRYLFARGQLQEAGVKVDGDQFAWTALPLAAGPRHLLESRLREVMPAWPENYVTEINLNLAPWFAAAAHRLRDGMILVMDYGYPRREYYHPQRSNGTLLCHYRHHVHSDPFLFPGLQDITAAVDFTAVAEAGAAAGLEVRGYTTQAHFLLACGLTELLEEQAWSPASARAESSRQARILTLPGEMGEICKVMALTKNLSAPLLGFSLVDQRARL